jgi:hypothetical protein
MCCGMGIETVVVGLLRLVECRIVKMENSCGRSLRLWVQNPLNPIKN